MAIRGRDSYFGTFDARKIAAEINSKPVDVAAWQRTFGAVKEPEVMMTVADREAEWHRCNDLATRPLK